MRMAQGEKLVKKWECRDEGENANGITRITLTDRRVATERVSTVGGETNTATQEVLLDSIQGVSYTNQKKETKPATAGYWKNVIIFAILGVAALFLKNLIGGGESEGADCTSLTSSITILSVLLFIIAGFNLLMALLAKKTTETAYRIILYTDASATLDIVGELNLGGLNAMVGTPVLGEDAKMVEDAKIETIVPVSYEVAKDFSETVGTMLIELRYGTEM